MSILQALILGLVQGLTEFLPVSSSAHLVLVPWWLGWKSPGLAFDTVLHLGTLAAVVAYFWRDWWELLQALLARLRGHKDEARLRPEAQPEGLRLLAALIVATIPAALLGYLLSDFFEAMFASPAAVAGFLLITGILLVLAETWKRGGLPLTNIRLSDALVIGITQAIAILPGISRSGSTIAAGLLRGLDRPAAARFSFLMSAPIIFGAGVSQLKDLVDTGFGAMGGTPLLVGVVTAAITGFLAIRYLLRYLQRHSLYIFAVYVWLFGLLTLARFFLA